MRRVSLPLTVDILVAGVIGGILRIALLLPKFTGSLLNVTLQFPATVVGDLACDFVRVPFGLLRFPFCMVLVHDHSPVVRASRAPLVPQRSFLFKDIST